MAKVRGVRFSEKEEALIEEFLRKNPYFDFSSLSRLATLDFIRNPKLELHPIRDRSRDHQLENTIIRAQ